MAGLIPSLLPLAANYLIARKLAVHFFCNVVPSSFAQVVSLVAIIIVVGRSLLHPSIFAAPRL